jgi:phosphate:Na+ symporter
VNGPVFTMLAAVVGGLGIFMLGMKYMSEGMQAVAGNSLRRMISLVTNNRLLATMSGTA